MKKDQRGKPQTVVRRLALCFLCGILFISRAHAEPLRILLPDRIEVREGSFYLGEYAELSGPPRLISKASMLLIRPTSSNLSRNQLVSLLSAGGLGGEEVVMQVPSQVELLPESPVAKALRQATSWGWRIDVQGVEYSKGQRVSIPAKVTPGARNLSVHLLQGTEKEKRHQVKLTWYQPILFAVRDIAKRVPLVPADLEQRIAQITYLQKALSEPSEALGGSLRKAVRAGSAILEQDIVGVEAVRAGQTVLLVGRVGELSVSTQALALERGQIGEVIRVKNLASRKVILARVVSAHRVEIGQEE